MEEVFPNIFLIDNRLAVENSIPGFKPFGDELINVGKKEFRIWNPYRSKAAAAIVKGISNFPINEGSKILYLGAAHGYTMSFLSSIIGKNGVIYGIEFSERCFKELLPLCTKYKNVTPILVDARKPELYQWIEKVDVIYCDVSQPDETEIAIRNCKEFLKPDGYLLLAIKSRSIDITRSPKEVYQSEIKKLKEAGFMIVDWKTLDPFEQAHAFVVAKIVE
jgi:fibrillarin-like pre-rRNA processing protein